MGVVVATVAEVVVAVGDTAAVVADMAVEVEVDEVAGTSALGTGKPFIV